MIITAVWEPKNRVKEAKGGNIFKEWMISQLSSRSFSNKIRNKTRMSRLRYLDILCLPTSVVLTGFSLHVTSLRSIFDTHLSPTTSSHPLSLNSVFISFMISHSTVYFPYNIICVTLNYKCFIFYCFVSYQNETSAKLGIIRLTHQCTYPPCVAQFWVMLSKEWIDKTKSLEEEHPKWSWKVRKIWRGVSDA